MDQNPFVTHSDVPDSPSTAEQQEVMGNIFFKGFIMNILELFLGVSGIVVASTMSGEDEPGPVEQ